MKNRKNIPVILGIVLLLVIGYYIPSIVMWLKDWSLMYEEKEVEIAFIQLDSQDVDMMEALDVFSDMLSNHLIVEMGDGFVMGYEESIKEDTVWNALYNSMQDFATMLDVKEEVELVEFCAQYYVMMEKVDEENMYSVWMCEGKDRSGKEYYFWVDASLNKVMAFDVPFELFGKGDEAFYVGVDRVVEYYDFVSYGYPLHSYAKDISDSLKYKYWSNEVEILDKELNIMISLKFCRNGDRFVVNVEPESANIMYYDAQKVK